MEFHYTRKQIITAIKHWTNQLKMLTESYNAIIDALIENFGKDVVLSKALNYHLTQQDLKKIFKILNMYMFKNQLMSIPVMFWPEQKIIDKINYHAIMSGTKYDKFDKIKCIGVYTAKYLDILNENGDVIDIEIEDDYILINQDELQRCTFIFAVAAICHEMIHYYDKSISQEYYHLSLLQSQTDKLQDFHKTKIFKNKMKEAKENGINVTETLSGDITYIEDNYKARFVLKQAIGEAEDPNMLIIKDEHTVFIKNKKNGHGFFVHFD